MIIKLNKEVQNLTAHKKGEKSMKKRIYPGLFWTDFGGYKISETGNYITCFEQDSPINKRFKIHNPGTPYSYFDAPMFDGVVRYNLADFVKGGL